MRAHAEPKLYEAQWLAVNDFAIVVGDVALSCEWLHVQAAHCAQWGGGM